LTPEVFNGAYVYAIADTCGGSCPSPVPVTVKFDLYLGGVLKHESATLPGNSDWQFLASGYGGLVDQVTVVNSDSRYSPFMDNITYSNPVPEPAALGGVLAGLGWLSLRISARNNRI
jgi:hypothetical protein